MKGPPQERRIPLELSWKSLFRRGLPRESLLRRSPLKKGLIGGREARDHSQKSRVNFTLLPEIRVVPQGKKRLNMWNF